MVVASRAKGHGKFVTKTFFYNKLNPNDFLVLWASSIKRFRVLKPTQALQIRGYSPIPH